MDSPDACELIEGIGRRDWLGDLLRELKPRVVRHRARKWFKIRAATSVGA